MNGLAHDVRMLFHALTCRLNNKPDPEREDTRTPFAATERWSSMSDLERDVYLDEQHGRMMAVRFVGGQPEGVEPGEVVSMTRAEANHFARLGMLEIVRPLD